MAEDEQDSGSQKEPGREAQEEALRLARLEREVREWVELIGPEVSAQIFRSWKDLF